MDILGFHMMSSKLKKKPRNYQLFLDFSLGSY